MNNKNKVKDIMDMVDSVNQIVDKYRAKGFWYMTWEQAIALRKKDIKMQIEIAERFNILAQAISDFDSVGKKYIQTYGKMVVTLNEILSAEKRKKALDDYYSRQQKTNKRS